MAELATIVEIPKHAKNKAGRPKGSFKLVLDENELKKVETLAGYGLNQHEVAAAMGIGERTLLEYKHKSDLFAAAWSRGKEKAKAYVAGKLMEKISEGDMVAIRWYEQTRCGRSEKLVTESNITHKVQSLEEYLREQEKDGRNNQIIKVDEHQTTLPTPDINSIVSYDAISLQENEKQ